MYIHDQTHDILFLILMKTILSFFRPMFINIDSFFFISLSCHTHSNQTFIFYFCFKFSTIQLMATANVKIPCYSCQKDTRTFICQGCSQSFCLEDLTKHIQELNKNFEEIETSHEQFGQLINDRKQNPNYDSLMKQIDQWEKQSVNKIKQVAENCREKLINFTNGCLSKFESKLNNLVRELKEIRDQDKFNEIDLNQMKTRLNKLNEEFDEPKDISIQQKPSTFIR